VAAIIITDQRQVSKMQKNPLDLTLEGNNAIFVELEQFYVSGRCQNLVADENGIPYLHER